MEFKGKFKEYTKNFMDGSGTISFAVQSVNTDQLNSLVDKDLRITAKRWREKRSLSANAYYWTIVSKIADAVKISKPHCHNIMMRRYGQVEMFDGQIAYTMLPDNDDTQKKMDEMEEAHFAPTSMTREGKDGVRFRAWKLLIPSHRFDKKQMSVLIDGIVAEAKELGIETLPKEELERMKREWGVTI